MTAKLYTISNGTAHDQPPRVWERQPHESAKAFQAFLSYWELGPERSLARVTEVLTAKKHPEVRSEEDASENLKSAKSGQVGLWSRKYRWNERAREWDAQAAMYYEQRKAMEFRSMSKRHLKQIRLTSEIIVQFGLELQRALQDGRNDFESMDIVTLLKFALPAVRLLPRIHKAERCARGVKLIYPKSNDGIQGPPEWQLHRYRLRGGLKQDEHSDPNFWTCVGDVAQTAEQLERQTQLWHRQSGESASAYAAFCAYRDAGPDRSLGEASRRYAAGKRASVVSDAENGSSRNTTRSGQIGLWCRKFCWVERCRAWDAYQTAVYKNAIRKDIEQMAEKHANEMQTGIEVMMAPVVALAKSFGRHRKEIGQMPASQIFRMFIKLVRHLPALHKSERIALDVELVDSEKDQAQNWRWRKDWFPRNAAGQ